MKKNTKQYDELKVVHPDLIEEYANWCAERIAEAYAYIGMQVEVDECINVATLEATRFVFSRPN
jgi:hypothetical protein